MRSATGARVERWRLVRLAGEPDRLARVVDHLAADAATGGWRIVRQDVMRADSVVAPVPASRGPAELAVRLAAAGFAVRESNAADAALVVELPEATLEAVPSALAALASALPDVPAEPNFLYFPVQNAPADYDPAVMWGLEAIEAPAAWSISSGSSDLVVAILDSGMQRAHPDLAANVWVNPREIAGNGRDDDGDGLVDDVSGWDYADNDADPGDQDGHGTHLAGTIGAVGANSQGVVGVNWRVGLLPVRIGNATFESAATLNGLRYVNNLRQRGARIVAVNASFGGDSPSTAFRDEIALARDRGILFIAAAGNDSTDNDAAPFYPASYAVENIIAVASCSQSGALSSFSNYGATSVDLAAPGTEIRSTIINGQYAWYSGTSMATPHVAGAVALVAAANPSLTGADIRQRILAGVEHLPALDGRVATGGRLNLRRAVAPSLVRPRVAITSPAADVVAMDRAGLPLALTATILPDNGVTAAASLAWQTLEGPAAVQFSDADAAGTTATFPLVGTYRVRVRAASGALAEKADLAVIVGAAEPTTAGLRAWWRGDESSGPALDASGEGRTGTLTNVQRTGGVFGRALQFDGSSSKVAFSAPALSRVTLAGWARADGAGNSVFPRIVQMSQGVFFFGLDPAANAADGNAGTLKFTLDNGAERRVWHSPPGTIGVGDWHHVAVSFDGASGATPRLFIDGAPQIVGVQESEPAAPSVSPGEGYLGNRGDAGRVWDGPLDEIRIYDRDLGATELALQAHLVRLRALLDGTFSAAAVNDSLARTLQFTPAASALSPPGGTTATWSLASGAGAMAFQPAGGPSTSATAAAPGAYLVRLDLTSGDRVHVVRTLPLDLTAPSVAIAGYYTGTTASGGLFALVVAPDGTGTFFGATDRGRFARGFAVAEWGGFSTADRSGAAIEGRIDASRNVVGTIGTASFTGARLAGSAADGGLDGFYAGWLLDTGVRAGALVAGGRIALAVEETGAATAASGDLNAGGFSVSPAAGASFAGDVGGGFVRGEAVLPARAPRRIVLVREGFEPARRLGNLSARGVAGQGDNALIPGFSIEGSAGLPVLVRGVGPGLAEFGLSGTLALPRLTLHRGETALGGNAGWDGGPEAAAIAAAAQRVRAFPLAAGSRDAALLATLTAGGFTAVIDGVDGGSGKVLAEIYDAREGAVDAELVNLSARGQVGTGDAIMIGGFAIVGDAPLLVLVRAAGPALADFGMGATLLAQPVLTVFRDNAVVASGQAWAEGGSAATVAEAGEVVHAFPFAAGSADAALLLYLEPGTYTAQVSGLGETTGLALLEVYRVPEF